MSRCAPALSHVALVALMMTAPLAIAAGVATTTQADPAHPTITSPRIAALSREIAAGNRAAAEAFWRERDQVTPLVEPIADDPTCSWVTFAWRGDADTRRVGLIGGPVIHDFSKWLDRLGDSDVWYRTERIPNDARFLYSFQVDRPAAWPTDPAKAEAAFKQYLPRPDPLNPCTEYDASVLELPDAPPQPWATRVPGMTPTASKLWSKIPGVPRGASRSHVIRSDILKQDRRVDVYLPIGYDPRADKPYKLLVLFEGSGVNELLDNLAVQQRMPPVVMAVPHFVNRNAECECSEPFADFVADELLAWLRDHYRVSAAREDVIVGGFSYSGLAAGFCAFRHPVKLGNVLTMSASYWWFPESNTPAAAFRGEPGWLTREYVRAPLPTHPPRFFLAAGRFEDYYPWSLLAENRRIRDVLAAKGYAVEFREFTGGHEPVSWRSAMVEGLIALTREGNAANDAGQ